MIDLRSDTVTRPTAAMRAAMMAADVGDDVYGDDPTVNRFYQAISKLTGKEAALFFPSGTQANLAAIMSHCGRGDEYIVGQRAHTYKFEGGGAAVLGSVQPQPIENERDGTLALDKIVAEIKPLDHHYARTRLLALENTIGGRILPAAYVTEATLLARRHGLATHLDGARIFNAAVGSEAPVRELCAPFDTVSICFSKGLGTPAGSVLVGSQALIERAGRWRKMLGGGMRQTGMLAAACHHALEHHVARLKDDHVNAARLAGGLRKIGGVQVEGPHTNMVFVRFPEISLGGVADHLKQNGILANIRPQTRFVTHLDANAEDIDKVVSTITAFFAH